MQQCLRTFRRTAHENGKAYMAGEVEAEMGILNRVVQAKDTLVTHGAAGCLNASGNGSGGVCFSVVACWHNVGLDECTGLCWWPGSTGCMVVRIRIMLGRYGYRCISNGACASGALYGTSFESICCCPCSNSLEPVAHNNVLTGFVVARLLSAWCMVILPAYDLI